MTPILYEKDEIDFTSQGLGSLVEIYDVDVEEQRNGLLQLTASYPVSGVRYADISVGRIILAKPNQRDDVHAFRIVSTELDISGYVVTIEADSITYDLTHNIVKHLNASGNGQAFMTALKNAVVNPSVFAFYSDIATSSKTSLNYVNPMEAIMGTTGSFLQIWGGELKRENRRVAMFNRRGRDNVSTFRLGKNIAGLKYSVDISSLVTRIIPTKSVQNDDQTTTTLEGTPVDSQYINNYEQIYTVPIEFTDDAIKTVADLNTAAKGWFTQSANTGRDKPTVTIDIDVLSLQDSADYQDKFKNLESVSLTDTVTVYVPEYGVNVTAIVNELHYDPILDRVTKMTVGTAKQSFADSSRTQLSDLQDKIISVQNQADAAAVSANGKSTNYYGSVEPSHPQEGDTWFWVNGDKSGVKQFVNGDWVDLVDSDTQEKIANAVTDAVTQAKAHTDEVKQGLATDIDTAKSQAASQASTAEANARSAATSQFTQAQNALSAAKSDLTNSIASEASARNAAVSAANSQAQTYANQAKADALNAVTKEVTDRQSAVSALDTKATNAVNQAKSDITDTINSISVGGRNLLLGTATGFTGIGINYTNGNFNSQGGKYSLAGGKKVSDLYNQYGSSGYLTISFDWVASGSTISGQFKPQWSLSPYGGLSNSGAITPSTTNTSGHYVSTVPLSTNGYSTGLAGSVEFRQDNLQGNITISNLKLEAGNKATDWTSAPEDVVLDYTTKDEQIKATITQYQTTNDGKVTKAQTDATTALGQVATKVSQTDYDQKTGDLSTKYTQVKQTADSQATDIVNIKETSSSQASKINSISSDVDGTKQSISDIETTQDSQSDKINQITTDVDGTKQSITDIQSKDGEQDTRMGNIETSVSGVKSDFVDYKTDANGRISTAQTTAQTAVDGLKTKVSQTEYNSKTGQLQTDLTATTQTANQAKTDIVSIKQKDGEQDARMTTIESDASGVKTTVSDLQTTQGKQSGDISTLQQRADGFDATVTKVNSLAVGGRNYLTGTVNTNSTVGANANNQSKALYKITLSSLDALYKEFKKTSDYFTLMFDWTYTGTNPSGKFKPQWNTPPYDISKSIILDTVLNSDNISGTATFISTIPDSWSGVTGLPYIGMRFDNVPTTGTVTISNMRLMSGNMSYPWTPAPEDLSSATAKAQLTADNAALNLSKYQTDADGRISKAQADIVTNANAITQKVSKTDYDKKTGDLTTAVSKAQTTADGVVTTVGNYQTSNDERVKSAESAISQNANDITLRATTDDLNSAKSDLNSSISQVKITADSISNFVRDSSGNISSDFQTALSKTSIITGSTLATSIKQQTSSQITSALTDNNGKIISLINQDSSGVQIAGKNIVLNGDTTVTGAFKVSQANIANGAIGTAQIGDAAITSAKIADLDVAKITGNISNFIQSNWNGIYGSVSISSLGMTVTTFGVNTEFNSSGMELTYANELTGGIGVNHWNGMPDNFQGLYFGLSGKGDFMSFGARDTGIEAGAYTSKLAWMRNGSKPSTMNSGWTFMDDVTFENNLIPKGASSQKMVLGTSTFNNNQYPYFGDSRYNAGLAYGLNQTYLISDGKFYNMTSIIKAFDNLGSIKIPSKIRSDGTVEKYFNLSI